MPEQNKLPLEGEVAPEHYQLPPLPRKMNKGEERARAIVQKIRELDERLRDNRYHSRWYTIRDVERILTLGHGQAKYGLETGVKLGLFEKRESKHYGYWWWYEYRVKESDNGN